MAMDSFWERQASTGWKNQKTRRNNDTNTCKNNNTKVINQKMWKTVIQKPNLSAALFFENSEEFMWNSRVLIAHGVFMRVFFIFFGCHPI